MTSREHLGKGVAWAGFWLGFWYAVSTELGREFILGFIRALSVTCGSSGS